MGERISWEINELRVGSKSVEDSGIQAGASCAVRKSVEVRGCWRP